MLSPRKPVVPALLLLVLCALGACQTTRQSPRDPDLEAVLNGISDEIVVCGQRFSTGVPVVLWSDRGGYNAYSTKNHFAHTAPKTGKRYTPGRSVKVDDSDRRRLLVPANSRNPEELAQHVDQFVLHYDVCGASERCFLVLHDDRELSVHFLLDVDGTIYQTMDLRDQAWHAAQANPRSVGIEIAQIGAYPPAERATLTEWYDEDSRGPFVAIDKLEPWKIRTPGFIARPRHPELKRGLIHGTEYRQYDFTAQQYDSLIKLTAALHRALPSIKIQAPLDDNGAVRSDAMSDDEYERFSGILGHYHITQRKQDPGPAFDWNHYLSEVRRELAQP